MAKNTKETIDNRRKELLAYIARNQSVTLDDLFDKFDASSITVRRDVNQLISENLIRKNLKGEFTLNHDPAFDVNYFKRYSTRHFEKVIIAKKAIDLVQPGHVIGIDSSTTTLELAKQLIHKEKITVITNNLFIPHYLTSHSSLTLFCIGGQVNMNNVSTEGLTSCQEISNYNYDISFFSADALDFETGLSNVDVAGINTKLSFLKNSAKKVLLLDSSKIQKKVSRKFLSLADVDVVITDSNITDSQIEEFERINTQLIIAELGEEKS